MVPTCMSALLDKRHAVPIPFAVAIFKLGKVDGVGQQFPPFEAMRDIEGDPVLRHPADQAKDRIPD
jgi:hypothetical protein